jgi:phospholipid/cholesterol/gamma-HCH transport system substrate-binding protein
VAGDTYYAAFSDASGLKPNDEVRIAGVRVGKVNTRRPRRRQGEGHLQDRHTLDVRHHERREIKVKTLLGAMYLASGAGRLRQLEKGRTIPLSRTRLGVRRRGRVLRPGRARREDQLPQLTTALNTLSDRDGEQPPRSCRAPSRALSALSANVRRP